MTCREIDLETAKVSGFVEQVNKESEFSGRDVLAILGDFGIGNSMEKSAALESASKRVEQLRAQRDAKNCAAINNIQALETAAPKSEAVYQKLRDLQSLKKDGLITEEDFKNKKQKLIDQL